MKKIIGLIALLSMGNTNCSLNIKKETPTIDNVNSTYTPEVINQLVNIYDSRLNELPICIFGEDNNHKYIVNEIQLPIIINTSQTSTRFNASNCLRRNDYLGMIHNHTTNPYNLPDSLLCQPSNIDMYRFVIVDEKAKIESVFCRGPVPNTSRIATVYKVLLPQDITDYFINLRDSLRRESDKK